jgi:hypothetical protein
VELAALLRVAGEEAGVVAVGETDNTQHGVGGGEFRGGDSGEARD